MNRLILMHFPAYSGGKFIANCLSLSKHTQPMTLQQLDYLSSVQDDYECRLNLVLQTLPAHDKISEWQKYEFSDFEFHKTDNSIKIYNSLDHFRTIHSCSNIEEWLQLHENIVIITLVNIVKFQKLAYTLKDPNKKRSIGLDIETQKKYEIVKGDNWPDWKQVESVGYNTSKLQGFSQEVIEEMQNFYPITHSNHYCFDIDETIFIKNKFMNAMHELYDKLEYDDFNERLIEIYWKKYINLHTGDKHGKTV